MFLKWVWEDAHFSQWDKLWETVGPGVRPAVADLGLLGWVWLGISWETHPPSPPPWDWQEGQGISSLDVEFDRCFAFWPN